MCFDEVAAQAGIRQLREQPDSVDHPGVVTLGSEVVIEPVERRGRDRCGRSSSAGDEVDDLFPALGATQMGEADGAHGTALSAPLSISSKDPGAVPRKVPLVRCVQSSHLQGPIESKGHPGVRGEHAGDEHLPVRRDGDEAGIEGGVEMRPEEEAVEHVEALGIAPAVRPGLDVAGAQEVGHGEPRDRATAVPVLEETTTEDVLAYRWTTRRSASVDRGRFAVSASKT